jgi:hypothetical protein
MSKYLKLYRTGGQGYWWLVESHREGGKVIHKKLKYWGAKKPGEFYKFILMELDDKRPLNDLWIIWQYQSCYWHGQKRGDYMYWKNRGQEIWFWKLLYNYVVDIPGGQERDVWLTRGKDRSEAIKKIKAQMDNEKTNNKLKQKVAQHLIPKLVLFRDQF